MKRLVMPGTAALAARILAATPPLARIPEPRWCSKPCCRKARRST